MRKRSFTEIGVAYRVASAEKRAEDVKDDAACKAQDTCWPLRQAAGRKKQAF